MTDKSIHQALQLEYPEATRISKLGQDWLVLWTGIDGWHGTLFDGKELVLKLQKQLE